MGAASSLIPIVFLVAGCVAGPAVSSSSTTYPFLESTSSQVNTTVSTQPPIGPTTTSIPPPPEAITGYGDFSDQDWYYIDPFLVMRLVVQCVQDHGFPARLIPPGDGITFADVPAAQNALGTLYYDACFAGLKLPDGSHHPGMEFVERAFRYDLLVADCLRAEGFEPLEAPSLEVYADTFMTGPWGPYRGIHNPSAALLYKCPQTPAGGLGNWNPEDGLQPLPPIESYDSP